MADPNKREELSGVVEDALGFNFRSLKTLRDLIVRPRTVFQAYAERDRVRYTPAIRLFLGLVGLQVLISTLWGGWAGLMQRQIETSDPAVRDFYVQISGDRVVPYLQHYGDAMGVAQPLLVAGFSSLSVFVLGWFRPGLSWPSRLNIGMGVLTVGSVVGLLLMPVLIIPESARWSGLSMLVIGIVYFITFLRGAPGVLADTTGGAWGKAFVFTLVLMLLVVLAGVVMALVGMGYALFRLGPA